MVQSWGQPAGIGGDGLWEDRASAAHRALMQEKGGFTAHSKAFFLSVESKHVSGWLWADPNDVLDSYDIIGDRIKQIW